MVGRITASNGFWFRLRRKNAWEGRIIFIDSGNIPSVHFQEGKSGPGWFSGDRMALKQDMVLEIWEQFHSASNTW